MKRTVNNLESVVDIHYFVLSFIDGSVTIFLYKIGGLNGRKTSGKAIFCGANVMPMALLVF